MRTGRSLLLVVALATSLFSLLLCLPQAHALLLPPDPFDATDRYALLLPAADGTITQIQTKISVPTVYPPGSGELIAKVRYKLPPSVAGFSGKPFVVTVSRAIPLQDLSPTGPAVVTFDFSDDPVPSSATHRSLAILYLGLDAADPQIVTEYPSHQLLIRPTGTMIETELTSSQIAEAGTVVVGPVTMLREHGMPQTESIRFDVPDADGVFFLRVTNGDAQGRGRVTAAVLTVNGQTIFRPSELNRKVAGVTRQISVQSGENVLDVTIRGKPGTQLTLEVVRQDGRVCRVLGPLTVDRATGRPETEEVTFAVAPQLSGPFTLRVINGDDGRRRGHGDHGDKDKNRRHRVDGGVITLNGHTIIQASDFGGGVTEITRVVTLQSANTLRVKLNGLPGDWITLEITGFDNLPPQVTITSPEPGAVVTAGPITVTGTVDDPSATVTVNGVVARVNVDGTFTAEGVPLQEGDNFITVVATDSCGNQGEDNITVRLDTGPVVPPDLLLCAGPYEEAPLDPRDITDCPAEELVRTRGTVFGETDSSAVTVQVEGVVLPDGVRINAPDPPIDWALREGTFFSASLWIPEPDGPHSVSAVATNSRGQERTATVTFVRDTVPPVLTVTSPSTPLVTNVSTVTITGTLDDPLAELWLIQPSRQRIPVVDGSVSFTVTLPTQQGTYMYWLVAWDPVDNAASVKLLITRDTILPRIDIYNPFAGDYVPSRTVTVDGVIIDQNIGPATLSVNSGPASPLTVANTQTTAAFSGVAQFNEGANTFSVTAVDKAGNTRTVTSSVTVDTVPPTISLTAPAAGAQLSGVVTVTAQAADVGSGLNGVSLLVDGQLRATDFAAPYTFSLDTLTVPAGARTLTVQAADRAGNTVDASRAVTVQPQLRAQITSPINGSTVLYSPILVQGTIVNNYGPSEIGLTVNGYVAEVQSGKFAVEGVALPAGANTLTATATDGAGVTATASVSVTVPVGAEEPPVRLEIISSNRVAPASVTFDARIDTASPIASYQLDIEGDGVVDFTGTTWSKITRIYPIAGLYLPTLTAQDTQGTTYTARTVVRVWDYGSLEALLRSKWVVMRDAASAGDLEGALATFLPESRDRFWAIFLDLGTSLPVILASIEQVHLLAVTSYAAEAETIRTEDGIPFSYPMTYRRDANGLWKLNGF